jgi:hypothetical protein
VTYHGKLRTRRPVLLTAKETGRFLGFVSIYDRLICTLVLMKFTDFPCQLQHIDQYLNSETNVQNEHYTSVYQHLQDNSVTKPFKLNKIGTVRINAILRRVRVIIVAVEKQYYTFRVCVSVALFIHHANRMRGIIL